MQDIVDGVNSSDSRSLCTESLDVLPRTRSQPSRSPFFSHFALPPHRGLRAREVVYKFPPDPAVCVSVEILQAVRLRNAWKPGEARVRSPELLRAVPADELLMRHQNPVPQADCARMDGRDL